MSTRHRQLLLGASCFVLLTLALAAPARGEVPVNQRAQVDAAVDLGLRFLAHEQNAEGAWSIAEQRQSPAVTSLAVLAFMARGHTPGRGEYEQTIDKGIDFILAVSERGGGTISGGGQTTMYDHGISTVMLTEACGMVDSARRPRLQRAIARSVQIILSAQGHAKHHPDYQGGWRYSPDSTDSDISISGWQLMALRGAANVGAPVPGRAIDAGVAYIRRRALDSGGFSYVGSQGDSPARTGTGVLALELLGQHGSKEATAGGQYLLRNPIRQNTGFYYYAVYYCSQAANQLGGPVDEAVNATIRSGLLATQNANTGAWGPTLADDASVSYATSMAILALTVPYHYLPLYQR